MVRVQVERAQRSYQRKGMLRHNNRTTTGHRRTDDRARELEVGEVVGVDLAVGVGLVRGQVVRQTRRARGWGRG